MQAKVRMVNLGLYCQMRSGGSGQPYPAGNLVLVEGVLLWRLLNYGDYLKSKQISFLQGGSLFVDAVVVAPCDSENDSKSACFHTFYSPLQVDLENYSMFFITESDDRLSTDSHF